MQALLEVLREDATLITVNRRLARAVINAHAERRIAAGDRTWRTPDVIPFAAWMERIWRQSDHAPGAALLRPAQERLLWEQVVGENAPAGEDEETPLEVAPAARQASRAYAIVNAWNISLDAREFDFSQESRVFRNWARGFEACCARDGWLDAGRAATALCDRRSFAEGTLRRRAVFAGFDIVTPQLEAIRNALSARGVDVTQPTPSRRKAVITRRGFDHPPTEIGAAAAWVRKTLRDAPTTRIGVVVPELHRMRAQVERVFDEYLVPGSALPDRAVEYRPFNLSFGQPVSRVPVVGDALLALKLGGARSELAAVGRLLRSPYLCGDKQAQFARAALDARLRDVGEPEISLRTLAARFGRSGLHDPGFEALPALRESAPRQQRLSAWAEFFSDWLGRLGWPGGRVLASEEFQAVEAFRGLLDELAGIGAVIGPVGFDRALALLLGLAEEHVFQPRAEPAPVQILGALETAGLSFDKIWITGLHDGSWPPSPEPNPLLPVTLQRRAGLPQASPEGQLELARLRLAGWLESADQVVLSYALSEKDEPLRPSSLITAIDLDQDEVASDSPAAAFGALLQSKAPSLEQFDDQRGPALAETRLTRGGAALIEDQSACPFRAFARWRLGARAVSIADSPLDDRVRGNLVHAILFKLWSEIQTHAALSSLTTEALRERVSSTVDEVLAQERRYRPETLRGMIAEAERERLCQLVESWLVLERKRSPFSVVAREEALETELGPLTLSIRPDRVDRLQSGDYFVLDYKTGRPQVKGWFGRRPDDPQLAVYTLVVEAGDEGREVAGAAYATLRRGGLGFAGLAASEGLVGGVTTLAASRVEASKTVADWKSLKNDWRETLDALAASFASGEARVDPKSPHSTCSHCQVKPLCRIFEQRANETAESGE